MDILTTVIEVFAAMSAIVGALCRYLRVNKLWKRKHEQSVAESISLVEKSLGFVIGIPFLVKFVLIDRSVAPGVNLVATLIEISVAILIGMGVWVKGNRKVGFWDLIKKSLLLEKRESTHLLKELLRPAGADEIIEILKKVAAIDRHVSEEEVALILKFADQWNIPLPEIRSGEAGDATNLLDLRSSVQRYLDVFPPPEQAVQLVDLIELMIKADDQVTKEEDLIHKELKGMLNTYAGKHDMGFSMFDVVLVPQNEEQSEAIRKLLPRTKRLSYRGGEVFLAGSFHSKEYAEEISNKYIDLGIFTTLEPN